MPEALVAPLASVSDLRAHCAAIDARLDTSEGDRRAVAGAAQGRHHRAVSVGRPAGGGAGGAQGGRPPPRRQMEVGPAGQRRHGRAAVQRRAAAWCTPITSARRRSSRRGGVASRSGDYEGAEAALTKALELSPNDPQSESLLGWAQMLQEKYDDALLNFQRVLMRQPANALARINVGYICLKKRIFGEAIEHLSKAIRLDNDRKATLYAHFYLGLVYLEREMYEDAQTFFQKTLALGPEPDRGVLRARPSAVVRRRPRRRDRDVARRSRREQVQSMGQALRGGAGDGGRRRGAAPRGLSASAAVASPRRSPGAPHSRPRRHCLPVGPWPGAPALPGRRADIRATPQSCASTSVASPSSRGRTIGDSRGRVAGRRRRRDTFPGLPRPARPRGDHRWRPTQRTSGDWVGPAVAGVGSGGGLARDRSASSSRAGRRHRPPAIPSPRCGTSSRTWRCTSTSTTCRRAGSTRGTRATRPTKPTRDDALATNVALALRGVPTLASLDSGLVGDRGGGDGQLRAGLPGGRRSGGASILRTGCR